MRKRGRCRRDEVRAKMNGAGCSVHGIASPCRNLATFWVPFDCRGGDGHRASFGMRPWSRRDHACSRTNQPGAQFISLPFYQPRLLMDAMTP